MAKTTTLLQAVDAAVNEYPGERVFTAIGPTSDDFTAAMVLIVQNELGTVVHPESVTVRASKQGSYSSIKIGPVIVTNPDQVVAIYAKMKTDPRLRWLI